MLANYSHVIQTLDQNMYQNYDFWPKNDGENLAFPQGEIFKKKF
jgi:hypothetical protein